MENKTNQAIGIFDSGIGGLTVAKEIMAELPSENIVYFGDTARVPYGNKSRETIQKFSLQIANFLLTKNIKILVVACNTASSFALEFLKQNLKIPVIGVIEPGAAAAMKISKNFNIGVIGTKGTIQSLSYQNYLKSRDENVKVFAKACPLFVPLVEEGWTENEISSKIAEEYLRDLRDSKIDTLILGCTHYPILKNVIAKIMGSNVNIVDSARETAAATKREIKKLESLNAEIAQATDSKQYRFFVSDDKEKFEEFATKFFNSTISGKHKTYLHTWQ